jgi:hypothetical protein
MVRDCEQILEKLLAPNITLKESLEMFEKEIAD